VALDKCLSFFFYKEGMDEAVDLSSRSKIDFDKLLNILSIEKILTGNN
jgi:hypothetical protein